MQNILAISAFKGYAGMSNVVKVIWAVRHFAK